MSKSILPAPSMDYNRAHLIAAYCIFGLAILGLVKLIEIISYFV